MVYAPSIYEWKQMVERMLKENYGDGLRFYNLLRVIAMFSA